MILNDEQRMLQESMIDFLNDQAPVEAFRTLRDDPSLGAYDQQLWRGMVELGLPGLTSPEAYGGSDFGWLGMGAVLEEMGRRLTAAPVLSSVVLAQELIRHCASPAQLEDWLPPLVMGEHVLTAAINEGPHYAPDRLETRWIDGHLSGEKTLVMDFDGADGLLVVARDAQGDGVVVRVAVDAPEMTVHSRRLMDGRNYASVVFNQTPVHAHDVLAGDAVAAGLARALDITAVAMASEMLGGARELIDRTVAHLSEREQFGVKIGSFQALQHRCAQLYCDLEVAASAVYAALDALDRQQEEITQLASAAKALANDCFQKTSSEAVQLHGGMGVTDEMDIGLFLKRSRVCNQLFGSSDFHRQRYASCLGI